MTDDLRLPAVAARLVAWHNRHPLARRIGPAQVHGIGYVALPFVGPAAALPAVAGTAGAASAAGVALAGAAAPAAGGSLRERALARARQQADAPAPGASDEAAAGTAATGAAVDRATLQPDFSERFIDLLHPREVARFAARFGQLLQRAPSDGPLRQVAADGAQPGLASATVYLLTAVIETGTQKSRVLLGCGPNAPVLGRRLWSRPRLHGAALLTVLMWVVPIWLWQADRESGVLRNAAPPAATAAAAASVAVAASSASAEVTAMTASAAKAPATTLTPSTTATTATAALASASAAATVATPLGALAAAERVASTPAAAVLRQTPLAAAPGRPQTLPVAAQASAPQAAQAQAGVGAPAPLAAPLPTLSPDTAARVQGEPASADAPIAAAPLPQASAARPAFPPASAAAASAPAPSRFRPRLVGKLAPALPSIRPLISDEDKAKARAARERLMQTQARGASPRPAAITGATAASVALAHKTLPAENAAQAAIVPPGSFAVSTRTLRTHAEAEQMLVAMRSLLRGVDSGALRVEILPQGDDWRVVGWPYARRAEADKARALLVSRGMRVEVVGF